MEKYALFLSDELSMSGQYDVSKLVRLLEIEEGLNVTTIDKLLAQLSETTLGIIYSYYYDSPSKSFLYIAPYKKEQGLRPTFTDVSYAEQEFLKLRDGWLEDVGGDKMSLEDFEEIIQSLFEKSLQIVPIVNYLQYKKYIAQGSGKVRLLKEK